MFFTNIVFLFLQRKIVSKVDQIISTNGSVILIKRISGN